ncbi:Adenosylcobinamide-GDP ribazoletransferase [compost metagenome]
MADHLPRSPGKQVLAVSALACVLIAGVSGALAVVLAALGFVWLRQVMLRRLGGTTGDTAGAMLELLEVAVLVGLALA